MHNTLGGKIYTFGSYRLGKLGQILVSRANLQAMFSFHFVLPRDRSYKITSDLKFSGAYLGKKYIQGGKGRISGIIQYGQRR